MTQDELREAYKKRLVKEKQTYIAAETGISMSVLSKFKNGKFDLYDHLAKKLEKYLMEK